MERPSIESDRSYCEPMAGVNVITKSTTRATSTDAEAQYVISANSAEILVFSFTELKSQEIELIVAL
jgi:hypothetical protein